MPSDCQCSYHEIGYVSNDTKTNEKIRQLERRLDKLEKLEVENLKLRKDFKKEIIADLIEYLNKYVEDEE